MKRIKEAALFDKLEVWENSDHPIEVDAKERDSVSECLKQIHNNPVRNKIRCIATGLFAQFSEKLRWADRPGKYSAT
jgi:hypothetical protein